MTPPRLNLVRSDEPDLDAEDVAPAAAAPRPDTARPETMRAEAARADDFRADPETAAKVRILEALLFAASEPLDEPTLAKHLKAGDDVRALLDLIQSDYKSRGINLVRVAGKWSFRTAEDLSYLLERYTREERKLSKAAMETLSIIAYHQPVTRAEIEEIRGVQTSSGTLDVLMETGWIRPRGRRRAPGRPITYGTTETFLEHFSLDTIKDLPGLAELKGAGLLDNTLPPEFSVPEPTDVAALMPDELPLDAVEQPELELADDEEEELADEADDAADAKTNAAAAPDGAATDHKD